MDKESSYLSVFVGKKKTMKALWLKDIYSMIQDPPAYKWKIKAIHLRTILHLLASIV